MPWDRFEAFAADLVALLPGVERHSCKRYGSAGHKQRGIDIFADRDDGTRWAFSNKRYREYEPHDARKHIADTTYRADRYFILTSGVVGTGVRDEIDKHPNWDLWDADNLSREVRDLAARLPDAARRIVDTHFGPHWRQEFLGLPSVAAFLTSTDYFRPLLQRHRLFHHGLGLVGRQTQLRQLIDYTSDSRQRICILLGRGGVGKSRLLKAFADDLDDRPESPHLRFQVESVPLGQVALDELPSEPCVVVVDDAHRVEHLGLLLAYARRRPNLKVLLAARPRGRDRIRAELDRSGFDTREVVEWPELRDLSGADCRELVRAALGHDRKDWAERLVRATGDCPLVTVIGARLLADATVPPELLDQHDEFRRSVLERLCDDGVGHIGASGSPDLTRRLLWVLSAVAPLDKDDAGTIRAVSCFLGADETDVRRLLDNLESVGVVVSRGGFFRITPDVLADHLLNEACLGVKGRPTGYAARVFAAVPTSAAKVLRNLAELDWRVREARDVGTALLGEIWGWIETWFHDGDFGRRAEVLDLIADAAYYQPGCVLRLVREAMRMKTPAQAPSEDRWLTPTRGGMIRRLPEILGRCGNSLDYLPECLDRLWELARDPDLGTPSQSDDPVRVIKTLAEYRLNWSFRYSQLVTDAIYRWARSSDPHPRRLELLHLIEPLFDRAVEYHEGGDDGTLRISWHTIPYDLVATIRDRAKEAVEAFLDSGDVAVQLQAIRTLNEALNEHSPGPLSAVPNELIQEWEPDQLQVLDVFDRLVRSSPAPVVHLHVLEALRFHARHGRLSGVRQRAAQVIVGIPETFDYHVTLLLIPALSQWDFWDDEADTDWKRGRVRQAERLRAIKQAVLPEFWRQHPTPAEALAEVDRRIQELRPAEARVEPVFFVWDLLDLYPQHAQEFASLILRDPKRPTAVCFGCCIQFVRRTDAALADRLNLRALDSGDDVLARVVGNSFLSRLEELPPSTGELDVIDRLLRNPDQMARERGVNALRHVGRHDPALAIRLIRGVEIGSSPELAKELSWVTTLEPDRNPVAAALTDDDLRALLVKLQGLPKIEHAVADFLRFVASRLPEEVLSFMLRRLEREPGAEAGYDFRPLPLAGVRRIFAPLAGSPVAGGLIRRVRDLALTDRHDRRRDLPRLYRAVSDNFSPDGLAALIEWFDSPDPARVSAAASLLVAVPPDFVFERFEFVRYVLERAEASGTECCEDVIASLYEATTSGEKAGAYGRPFPRDESNRDRARERLGQLQPGTPLHRLYDLIHREAERSISDSNRRHGRDDG